ncbi:MAG: nucleoside 2-deoxyribosyltransferase [Mesobacillus sp.]|uniref:nucleoside 2-deoxyribosyltransferase n=1 Tax=Mesobacillus sp. TaxID=2675271 RepID=UPI003C4E18BE
MNFYIASSLNNKEMVKSLADQLKMEGFYHSYDWTINDRADSMDILASIGERELSAVRNSDFLVMLLPGGKGSHIEMGIALGLGKRVYLYSPNNDIYEFDKTSTFYHVAGVTKFIGDFVSFMQFLLQKETTNFNRLCIQQPLG